MVKRARLVCDSEEVDGACVLIVQGLRGGGVCEEERKGSEVPGRETSRWSVWMRLSMRVKSSLEDLWMGGPGASGGVGSVEGVGEERDDVVSVGVWIAPKRLRTASKRCLMQRGVGAAIDLGGRVTGGGVGRPRADHQRWLRKCGRRGPCHGSVDSGPYGGSYGVRISAAVTALTSAPSLPQM